MTKINITKTESSRIGTVDMNNIVFGRIFSDHMFEADFDGEKWTNFQIRPTEKLSVHPGNMAWHYGQSIFEGMKASLRKDGTPLLMRPELHGERLNASARRMSMPEFPIDVFLEALHTLVGLDRQWIPQNVGSALYIRPFMFATDEFLGVRASTTYKMMILTAPAGPYYGRPVRLKTETEYVRAAPGGVGEAKTAGNYAASLYPAKLAKEQGFDQIMWLDCIEYKWIQEVGTMNIFFVIGDTVVTPAINGMILKGITRKMVIEVLAANGYKVEERPISIDEVIEAHKAGTLNEIFGTGTAAVLAIVNALAYKDELVELDDTKYQVAPFVKNFINGLRSGDIEDTFGWTVPVREPALVG